MITCREMVERLLDFVNEELAPELRQRLEEHLKECPPCTVYVETYQITLTISRQLPTVEMSPETAERLRAALGCAKSDKTA